MLGVVLNAGALDAHVARAARRDQGRQCPVDRVHITNVHAREAYRHHSWLSPAAKAVMAGLGVRGYALAIAALILVTVKKS